jgi:hypothetical protein
MQDFLKVSQTLGKLSLMMLSIFFPLSSFLQYAAREASSKSILWTKTVDVMKSFLFSYEAQLSQQILPICDPIPLKDPQGVVQVPLFQGQRWAQMMVIANSVIGSFTNGLQALPSRYLHRAETL